VDTLLSAPLLFQPGTAFYYAMNHDVIARIIEVVSGQDFGEFMHDRLLKPLNMTHTWWIIPDSAMHLLANAYVFRDSLVLMDRGNAIQSTFPRGNGQMVSTPLDYMKFILMLAKKGMHGEKRILSEQSVEWMTTDMLPPAIELKVGSTVFSDTGFGLGVAISRNSLQPWEEKPLAFENLFSHLPAGCYFWPGVVNTYWWVDPENELCGLVFTQLGNPGKINNFQEFTQTFYRYFFYEK